MTDFLSEIPPQIAAKVEDKDWSLTFIFEEMPCKHQPDAPQHEKIDCIKCQSDDREKWLEAQLTDQDPKEKRFFVNDDGSSTQLKLSKITVKRGKYDDCIGIEASWN